MSPLVEASIIGFAFAILGGGMFLAGSAFLSWQFKLRLPSHQEMMEAVQDAIAAELSVNDEYADDEQGE